MMILYNHECNLQGGWLGSAAIRILVMDTEAETKSTLGPVAKVEVCMELIETSKRKVTNLRGLEDSLDRCSRCEMMRVKSKSRKPRQHRTATWEARASRYTPVLILLTHVRTLVLLLPPIPER